jgi:hypothetical protein
MEWALEWAPHLDFLEGIAEGDEDIQALQSRPDVSEDLTLVVDAYFRLSRARPVSMAGVSAIPISEMEALYRVDKLDEVLPADVFIDYVQFLDDVFREWYRKHQKKGAR